MYSHAQVPFSILLNDRIRIYFSTREKQDQNGLFKSYSGYVDVDKKNPKEVIAISDKPIIDLGDVGEFDEFGSMAGSVVFDDNKYLLYYCGWQRAVSTPYNWSIGLALSKDGMSFKKIGKGPLLGNTPNEPYLQACPIVFKDSKNSWHMFYLSGIKWLKGDDGKKESQYLLMHSISQDGFEWKRNGVPIIKTIVPDECQTSSSIIYFNDKYHMFFSYRHGLKFRENKLNSYKIGYAVSDNLINWKRHDELAGIGVSDSGWDSQMIGYPNILQVDDKVYLFYCGNQFGTKGFGYAELSL